MSAIKKIIEDEDERLLNTIYDLIKESECIEEVLKQTEKMILSSPLPIEFDHKEDLYDYIRELWGEYWDSSRW